MKILIKKMRCFPDVISGALIVLAAIVFYTQTGKIKMFTALSDSVGPRFFPRLVLILLMLMGALLIVSGVRGGKKRLSELDLSQAEPRKKTDGGLTRRAMTAVETNPAVRSWISIVGIFLFILLMKPLGFAISGAIYLFLQFTLLAPRESRKIWLYAILAIVISGAAYFLFRNAIGINLPAGLLEGIF